MDDFIMPPTTLDDDDPEHPGAARVNMPPTTLCVNMPPTTLDDDDPEHPTMDDDDREHPGAARPDDRPAYAATQSTAA